MVSRYVPCCRFWMTIAPSACPMVSGSSWLRPQCACCLRLQTSQLPPQPRSPDVAWSTSLRSIWDGGISPHFSLLPLMHNIFSIISIFFSMVPVPIRWLSFKCVCSQGAGRHWVKHIVRPMHETFYLSVMHRLIAEIVPKFVPSYFLIAGRLWRPGSIRNWPSFSHQRPGTSFGACLTSMWMPDLHLCAPKEPSSSPPSTITLWPAWLLSWRYVEYLFYSTHIRPAFGKTVKDSCQQSNIQGLYTILHTHAGRYFPRCAIVWALVASDM